MDRQPIGMIRRDSQSGQIDFSPLKGKSPLPDGSWDSVDQLKRAVTKAYSKTIEAQAVRPGLPNHLLPEDLSHAQREGLS